MEFKGDIIITDPYYIMKDEDFEIWDSYNLNGFGINTYICRDTMHGYWDCAVFNADNNEIIGEFCGDSGMVGVFLLDEVLKYNSDFDYHIEFPWATTIIKNFDGKVIFETVREKGIWKDDDLNHKKGDKWKNSYVSIVGNGNVNFYTRQID